MEGIQRESTNLSPIKNMLRLQRTMAEKINRVMENISTQILTKKFRGHN